MTLLVPLGLLALLSLPAIIILHLLRERRRRVVVPSLLLWQLLPQRREAQRKRRLPLTLLLLLHLLAAALLALALAQPQWALDLLGREEHLALIIDTSTSMAAPAPGPAAGSRLAAARSRAQALIAALGGGEIVLIAAGPQAHLVDSAGAEGAPRLLAALAALQAGGTGSDIPGALTLAEAALSGRPGARIIVLTDAAIPTLSASIERRPPAMPISWELVGAPLANRAIVTLAARPRGPGGPTQVYARAVNYGDAALRTRLRLFGDDTLLDTRSVSFQPNGEVELTWTLPAEVGMLRAELDADDDLPIDDTASLSLATTRPLRTLLVSAGPAALERALRAIPGLSLELLDPQAYPGSPLADQADLTIFEDYLPEAWPAGGVLAVNPPAGALLERDGRALNPEAAALRLSPTADAALFDGISLAGVSFGPLTTLTPPSWLSVQVSRGEQPLILRGRSGPSEVAVWAFDLAGGNLVGRLAFPLLVARTVRDLTPAPLPGAALLGARLSLRADPRADALTLTAPDGSVDTIALTPGTSIALELAQAGRYQISERQGGREIFTGALAVNAGAPSESALAPYDLPQPAPAAAADPAAVADESRRPLWPWLAALALVVMVGEWIYVHGRRSEIGVRG